MTRAFSPSCFAAIAVALCSGITALAQEDGGFSFRGTRLGQSFAELEPLFRDPKRSEPSCVPDRDADGVKLCKVVLAQAAGRLEWIGPLQVHGLYYQFLDNRVAAIILDAPASEFWRLREMLIGRYGEPSSQYGQPPNRKFGWPARHGAFELHESGEQPGMSSLTWRDHETENEIVRRRVEKLRARGKDAF